MENYTIEFYDLITEKLKDKSIETDAPNLFKNAIYLYPEEIYPFMFHKNQYVMFYSKAIMIYNIIGVPVVKPQFIDYIFEAESFATEKPEFAKSFYFHLDQAASLIIRKTVERLDPNTKRLAQLASKIKSIDSEFVHSFSAMQLKLSSLISELQLKVYTGINERIISAVLNNLDFYSHLEFDVESFKVLCISPIITYIQSKNGIIPSLEKLVQNVEFDKKILVRIREMLNKIEAQKRNEDEKLTKERKEVFDQHREDIKNLLYKLEYQEPEDESKPKTKFRTVKTKAKRIPRYMEVKLIILNPKQIYNIEVPGFQEDVGSLKVSYYNAEYDKNKVMLKVYEFTNTQVLDSIYSEAKIYQILSQNISQDGRSCFLKYYGTIFEDTKVTLVMESFQENLKSRIEIQKTQSKQLEITQKVYWMANLIKSLQIMDKLNIYHGDISINNISIDDQLNLKFINFKTQDKQNILINKEDSKDSETRFPEKPSTKDIYDMGVVFLQILTFENVPDRNTEERKDYILKIADSIKQDPTKDLVKKMLDPNPKSRPKLIAINQMMDPIETATHNSSYQNH